MPFDQMATLAEGNCWDEADVIESLGCRAGPEHLSLSRFGKSPIDSLRPRVGTVRRKQYSLVLAAMSHGVGYAPNCSKYGS